MSSSYYRPPPVSNTMRMKRALALAGCGVLTVSLSACQSTQQESAKIGREGRQLVAAAGNLRLGAVNHSVRASEVRLSSSSSAPQAAIPVLVEVSGAGAKQLYTNATGGLETSLQQMSQLTPHGQAWWVDDQVLTSQSASGVRVRVGSGRVPRTSFSPSTLTSTGLHLAQQAGLSVLAGELVNHTAKALGKVPVYAVALAGRRVVAAGRAVVGAPSRSTSPFQIFLVGNPAGARLELSAAPSAG
jgi:hypothetical protein